jgi:hypothetical protein
MIMLCFVELMPLSTELVSPRVRACRCHPAPLPLPT